MIFNLKRIIYTWISFHGITDILLPVHKWLPIYSLSLTSVFIPMNILNSITVLLSSLHFKNDLYLNEYYILTILSFLLLFGNYKFSQTIILTYMSLIHVPMHLINITYDHNMVILLLLS